jgi:hypothetical protein
VHLGAVFVEGSVAAVAHVVIIGAQHGVDRSGFRNASVRNSQADKEPRGRARTCGNASGGVSCSTPVTCYDDGTLFREPSTQLTYPLGPLAIPSQGAGGDGAGRDHASHSCPRQILSYMPPTGCVHDDDEELWMTSTRRARTFGPAGPLRVAASFAGMTEVRSDELVTFCGEPPGDAHELSGASAE